MLTAYGYPDMSVRGWLMGWFPPTRYQLKGMIMKFNGNTKITLFSINLDPTVVPNVQIDFSKNSIFGAWTIKYFCGRN
jgi:hypothetical protein